MKKLPASIKPDVETYFLAKRMEASSKLRPGQALMLAATIGLQKPKRDKTAAAKKGTRK